MSTSWLRRRALKAVADLTCEHSVALSTDVADAIEQVARDFAERTTNALRLRLPCTHYLRSGDAYRAAIAEADKDE